jgi:glucose/arabinose dehydrogenase
MTELRSTLTLSLTGLVAVACGFGLVSAPVAGSVAAVPRTEPVAGASAGPELEVTTVLSGLDLGWDTAFLPDGAMLVTERVARRILLRTPTGEVRVVGDSLAGLWAEGETGPMSLAVDPGFTRNRRFYTCHGAVPDTGHAVRVMAWRLNAVSTRANRTEVLVSGIPATTGRHGGCRLELGAGGALFLGTGDATVGENPQRLTSLGGKVLRVDRHTGAGLPGNPFAGPATQPNARSSPTATATCRASPCGRTVTCGRSSTAPTATTR